MHRLVIDVDGVRRSGCRGRLVDDRCRCVGSEARGAPEKGDRVLPWIILRFVAPYGDLIASSGTPRSSSYSFVCPSCCMPSLSCSLLVDLCDMAAGSAIRSYRKQSRPFLAFVSGAAAHRWLQKLVGLGECEDEGDSGASASLLGYLAGLLCALVSGVCLPCSETGIFGDQHDYVPLSWCEAEGSWSRSCLLAPASDISGDHIEVLECVLACEPLVTLGPDRSWSGRLNAHSNAGARLVRTYALLSTLGGGHFMCRQVMHSLLLARMQGAVARAMGDETLAGKCRINEGYGLIWLGQYRAARHLIAAEEGLAREEGDTELLRYAQVALLHCRRCRVFNRRKRLALASPRHHDGSSSTDSVSQAVVHDEFHRIRKVRPVSQTPWGTPERLILEVPI